MNTRERFQKATENRNRQKQYAKESIPKPRVVKRLNVVEAEKHQPPNFDRGKYSNQKDLNVMRQQAANSILLDEPLSGFTNQQTQGSTATSAHGQGDSHKISHKKSLSESLKSDDDNLLYMLARHKREQNALEKLANKA